MGDPLEFKLETQDGENLLRDIFATNVIAKDPYSDRYLLSQNLKGKRSLISVILNRIVQLIDVDGCPVDPYVFPALGLSRLDLMTVDGIYSHLIVSEQTMDLKPDSMHSKYQSQTSLSLRQQSDLVEVVVDQ